MKASLSSKELLREELKKARKELSLQRREEASHTLLTTLLPLLASYQRVLSFSSLPQEVDLSLLNRFLASTDRLLLPQVVENTLKIFSVNNLEKQLERGAFGLFEPIATKCDEVPKETIDIVLVPALGFDRSHHRIGYGKGYYDRFLASIPACPTIGVGFKEQLLSSLPITPNDHPLTSLTLV